MERTFHMLLYRAFHAQRNQLRPCIGRIGLEVGQPKILTYLAQNGPCPQKQLADYFDVDSAAVSRMLDSLEKGGFITRKLSERSRRSNLIELTARGRQASDAWQDCCGELEERMLRGFTQQEREQFADYLARAYQNLHTKKGEGHEGPETTAEISGRLPVGHGARGAADHGGDSI